MLTKEHLELLKAEMDRCDASGDPGEQRRAAVFGPLVEFALWAHAAIIAIASGAGDTVVDIPATAPQTEAAPVEALAPGKRTRTSRRR